MVPLCDIDLIISKCAHCGSGESWERSTVRKEDKKEEGDENNAGKKGCFVTPVSIGVSNIVFRNH